MGRPRGRDETEDEGRALFVDDLHVEDDANGRPTLELRSRENKGNRDAHLANLLR